MSVPTVEVSVPEIVKAIDEGEAAISSLTTLRERTSDPSQLDIIDTLIESLNDNIDLLKVYIH